MGLTKRVSARDMIWWFDFERIFECKNLAKVTLDWNAVKPYYLKGSGTGMAKQLGDWIEDGFERRGQRVEVELRDPGA